MFYGVDSSYVGADQMGMWEDHADRPTRPTRRRETLYEFIARTWRRPVFWGRYIGRRETEMNLDEVNYLHRQGCLVLVVYNGVRTQREVRQILVRQRGVERPEAQEVRSIPGDRRRGREEAARAIDDAVRVGIPPGVRIYADVERWRFNPEWLIGWWEGMNESPYAGLGGIYGNPLAWGNDYARAREWWLLSGPALGPYDTVWSNRMQGRPRPAYSDCGEQDPTFLEAALPPLGVTNTVIWQYAGNCGRRLYDKDLATRTGINDMWGLLSS